MPHHADPDKPLKERKDNLRRRAYDARNAQGDKDTVSRLICEKLVGLPEYQRASTVMWYLHCRSEVQTGGAVRAALGTDKRVVIPYCTVDEHGDNRLGLWNLHALDELVTGTWNILEPPRNRWNERARTAEPRSLDFIIVPGVAFGRDGARLGNGAGYYDRLLANVRKDTVLAAVCYESQLFDDIPLSKYDVTMDKIVTENAVYEGIRRRRR